MPVGAEEGILRGMYKLKTIEGERKQLKARLLGSGAILREVEAGAELLAKDFGVTCEVWSVTSFTELRREGLEVERWNRLHPEMPPKISYVEQALSEGGGPVVASTDYIKVIPDGIRPFVPGRTRFTALGTDGFGRSDYRRRLRAFFEVDRHHVAVAALKALADDQLLPTREVNEAIHRYGIDADRPIPTRV
jgi:pyruvate dehydrogenase E1 component